MGRGRCSGAWLCPLLSEREGEERRSWGSGAPYGSKLRERERWNRGRAVGEGEADRRAQPISGGERGEGGVAG